MDAGTVEPPEGFVIDAPAALPEGFQIDAAPDAKEPVAPSKPDWATLFSGVDEAKIHLTIPQRKAFDELARNTDNSKETQAQAFNISYVSSRVPNMSPEQIHENWVAVKDSFASNVLGIKTAGLSDSALYSAIGEHERAKQIYLREEFAKASPWERMKMLGHLYAAHNNENVKEVWDSANKPFIALPRAQQFPDVPGLGANSPAVAAGVYNSVVGVLEGVETPLGVATLPVAGSLKALSASSKLAKTALISMSGVFTGLMAKATVDAGKEGLPVLKDPKATLQQKIEAVGTPVATGAVTLLGALGTAMELKTPMAREKLVVDLKGKSVGDSAAILRAEAANPANEPALTTALQNAAEKLEQITPEAVDAKAKEAAKPAEPVKTEEPTAPEAPKAAEAPVEPAAAAVDESPLATAEAQQMPAAEGAVYSIKNAALDPEMERQGLPKAEAREPKGWEVARADAASKMEADPLAGRKLVQQLKESNGTVTDADSMLLLHEEVRLTLERQKAEAAKDAATAANDPVALAAAEDRIAQVRADLVDTAAVAKRAGTETGRALNIRKAAMKQDYSLAAMETRLIEAQGGEPLSVDQVSEVKALHEQIVKKQAEFDEYRSRMSELLMDDSAPAQPRRGKPPSKLSAMLSEQANAARERIKARMAEGRVSSGLDPADLADHVIVGADYIAKGVDKFADWSLAMVKDLGDKVAPHLKQIYEGAVAHVDSAKLTDALERRKSALEKRVKELKEKIEKGDLSSPAAKAARPSVKEIEKLEQQRDSLSAELTRMRKEAADVKALEEAIKEKDAALKSGDIAPEGRAVNRPSGEAVEKLKQERDVLNKQLAKARQEAAKPTDEELVQRKVDAIKESIAEKRRQLETGNVDPAAQAMNRPAVEAIEKAKQELEAINAEIAQARKGPPVPKEERALEAYKTRTAKRIEELKQREATGDTSPPPKRQPIHLDEEANRLQAELEHLKLEDARRMERARYDNLTPLQKAAENAVVGWDSTRSILAGFEFSAVARQGAFRLFSHPVETVKTMGDAFRALVSSPENAHAINLKTLNDPAAVEARANKLALVDQNSVLSKQEEVYMGKLVGKIPGVRNFEQFAHVFLNKVRLDMWKEFRGDFPDANPKLVADFINSATGRGALGSLERNAVTLNRIFFSPRFVASRIQMGSGYYMWKAALAGDKAAVRAISGNYARTMIGYGVFLSALYAGFKAYTDEDVSLSFDPKSSDFVKLKVGNTRVDMGAGVQQPLVFLSRLATGDKTNAKGKTVALRGDKVPFGGGDAYEEAGRFVRSKFNPSLSKAVDFTTGKNIVGQPATLTDLLYPATYGDIKDAFSAHDIPEATMISLLAMFGAGVQTYDATKTQNHAPKRAH